MACAEIPACLCRLLLLPVVLHRAAADRSAIPAGPDGHVHANRLRDDRARVDGSQVLLVRRSCGGKASSWTACSSCPQFLRCMANADVIWESSNIGVLVPQVLVLRVPQPFSVHLLRRLLHRYHAKHAGKLRAHDSHQHRNLRARCSTPSSRPCGGRVGDAVAIALTLMRWSACGPSTVRSLGIQISGCANLRRCTQIAYMISGMVYFMWSLHCGFIIAEPSYPGWWIWLYVSCPTLLARTNRKPRHMMLCEVMRASCSFASRAHDEPELPWCAGTTSTPCHGSCTASWCPSSATSRPRSSRCCAQHAQANALSVSPWRPGQAACAVSQLHPACAGGTSKACQVGAALCEAVKSCFERPVCDVCRMMAPSSK